MDISDIAMLEAILKYGSINKASEVLYVSQPTLSKRLGRLEYKLGTPLFLRTSSGLIPTSHAEYIIESAKPIKTEILKIERHIELMNTLEEGELRIGVGPVIEQLYFPHVLHKLTEPPSSKLNISIRTEAAGDLLELLLQGQVDISIGPFDQSYASDDYVIIPITSQPLVYAANASHPLAKKIQEGKQVTKNDIASYPFVSPHAPEYIAEQSEVFGHRMSSQLICDNYSVIIDFLKEGYYVASGPVAVFSDEAKAGSLVLIPDINSIVWEAACVVRPQTAVLPFMKKVIDIFCQYKLPAI